MSVEAEKLPLRSTSPRGTARGSGEFGHERGMGLRSPYYGRAPRVSTTQLKGRNTSVLEIRWPKPEWLNGAVRTRHSGSPGPIGRFH